MKTKFILVLTVLTAFFALSCKQEPEPELVGFYSLFGDGGKNISTTTGMNIKFSHDFDGFAAEDITLDAGNTGAILGNDLRRENVPYNIIYQISLKNVSSDGMISISLAKPGYKFTPNMRQLQVYYHFNANIPAELAAAWYMSAQDVGNPDRTPQYTINSDGKLLVNGQDNNLQISVSGDTITTYNNKEKAGTAKFSISETELTITEATSGNIIINGTFHKASS